MDKTTSGKDNGQRHALADLLQDTGLVLTGLVVSSEVKEFQGKDGGQKFRICETNVLAGKNTVVFKEFERDIPLKPRDMYAPIKVSVESANMDGRNTIMVTGKVIL